MFPLRAKMSTPPKVAACAMANGVQLRARQTLASVTLTSCTNKIEYTCSDIQTENPGVSDDELRTRVARPEEMNILGS